MYRLKEGIRSKSLEFNKEYNFSDPTYTYNLLEDFAKDTKSEYRLGSKNYLAGEFSLFLYDKLLYPICIVSDYESTDNLGSILLIDKDFFHGSIPDIKDEIIRIIDLLKSKKYRITIIKNLKSYIFEDIRLPDFNTLEDMDEWLDRIKKKWLKNERKKIRKTEEEIPFLA